MPEDRDVASLEDDTIAEGESLDSVEVSGAVGAGGAFEISTIIREPDAVERFLLLPGRTT